MDRRGFFANIFKRKREAPVFFGLQVICSTYQDDDVPARIRAILAEYDGATLPAQKQAMYKRVTALLADSYPFFEYAFWDFVDKPDDARAEFASWQSDIEASIATEEEEMGETHDEMFRMNSEKYFYAVSMMFLLDEPLEQAGFLDVIDALEPEEFWRKETILRLVQAVNRIDFDNCESDAIFIIPGNDSDGLSWEDIHGGGWDYIRSIA